MAPHYVYQSVMLKRDVRPGLHESNMIEGFDQYFFITTFSRQIFGAVHHVYTKQVLHRDIKGDNILMSCPDVSDPSCTLALSDFGTAISHDNPNKQLSQLTGTRVFWSPEFCNKRYSYPADVWAVGEDYLYTTCCTCICMNRTLLTFLELFRRRDVRPA